jgi:aryl-alcohol dehydrogenase-like predicted oxidoreductase
VKVPPPAWGNAAEAYQKTLDAVQLSLQRMGLDYVDLMLLHAAGAAEGRPEAWRALETAQEKVRMRTHVIQIACVTMQATCVPGQMLSTRQ